jgi:hypothetical protein
MSEHASADNSRAYRRSVAAFAALGYAWVLGCLLLATCMVAWVLPQLLQGRDFHPTGRLQAHPQRAQAHPQQARRFTRCG